jgi:diketogulonate reductase-like aldo/keto reductase
VAQNVANSVIHLGELIWSAGAKPMDAFFIFFQSHDLPNAESGNPRMELASVPLHSTWSAMEQLHDEGLVRQIGVANYNCLAIRDLLSYARVKPAVLQVRIRDARWHIFKQKHQFG